MPRHIPRLALVIAMLVGFALSTGDGYSAGRPGTLIGAWMLTSGVNVGTDGSRTPEYAPNDGFLTFDATGRFSQQLLRADMPKFASNDRATGTPDENRAAIKGGLSFFGTYSVDETGQLVTLHIERSSFPNWSGATQIRRIVLLSPTELKWEGPSGSAGGRGELAWKRVR
jgi:Lipocalin-like domain